MFRDKPSFTISYRNYRVEVRLVQHPKGVITDLRIYSLNDSALVFSVREEELFVDSDEASRSMTAIAFGFVDSLIVKMHAGKRPSFE